MRLQSFLQRPKIWQVGPILLAVTISLTAGATALLFASPLSPLIVAGGVVAVAFGIACLQNPTWALYVAIFLSLLPMQLKLLLPNYSILFTLLLALLYWFLNAAFHRRRIIWVSTVMLIGCFLIWGIVTLLWAPGLVLGRRELVEYAFGFLLLLLLVNEVSSLKTLDGLMKTLALSGWALVLAGVGSVLFQGYQPGTRLQVMGMNENEFGLVILVAMTGVLWQKIRAPERQQGLRTFFRITYIVLALGLVALSGSRGSAVSLLVTLLLFWFWKPTRRWGNLTLLILVVVSASAPFIFATTLNRLVDLEGGILGGRQLIWPAAWQLIRDHPWGGVGIGNGNTTLIPYLRFTSFSWETSVAIHNPPLAVWAETGILGLLLYLGALGSALWRFIREYFRCRSRGLRSLTLYFALVSSVSAGYMLTWIKGGGLEVHVTYFLILALLLIPSQLDQTELEGDVENEVGRGWPGAMRQDQRPGLP